LFDELRCARFKKDRVHLRLAWTEVDGTSWWIEALLGLEALRMTVLSAKLLAKIPRTDRRTSSRRFPPDGRSVSPERRRPSALALKCQRKFLRYYPSGFVDADYLDLERGYKWTAHERWSLDLGKDKFEGLLQAREFGEIAARAVGIEARTNLLFSFEKMALRDAVKAAGGAKSFAEGLFEFLHSDAPLKDRFTKWTHTVAGLPRRQTRVLTWPVVTVFGFIAQPRKHFLDMTSDTRQSHNGTLMPAFSDSRATSVTISGTFVRKT
jgi:hypothetical protein